MTESLIPQTTALPTVKIKAVEGEGQDGYIIINKSDFDPAVHELFVEVTTVSDGPEGFDEILDAEKAAKELEAKIAAENASNSQAEVEATEQRAADSVQRKTRRGLNVSPNNT